MNGAETGQAGLIRRCFLARKVHFRADAAGERTASGSECYPHRTNRARPRTTRPDVPLNNCPTRMAAAACMLAVA